MGQALRIADTPRPALALELPTETSFDEWVSIGRRLCIGSQALSWHIGDWWAFGDHRYGDRAKAAAEGIFGRDFGTLMNLASVARAYEPSRRREVLSFSHHVEVAAIARTDPGKADELLDAAANEHWSKAELRRKVAELSGENNVVPIHRTPPQPLPAELRKAYETAVELGEALQNTRQLRRRERYLLDFSYAQLNHANQDLRPCPDDFRVIFVEKGRLACEEWYKASRVTISRWLVECGKDKLISERADFVDSGRQAKRHDAPAEQHEHFDERDPLYIVAREAADYLRISRYGGWRITAEDDGSWRVGTVHKTSDELIAMAERQGFDSASARMALRDRVDGGVKV